MVEQGLLGIASLLLAARLGVRDFAPISALFIVNSVAVTLSNLGLGYAVLRLAPGTAVRRGELRRLRIINSAVAAAAVGSGALLGGDVGVLVAGAGVIWATSAEAFVRKSAATRDGHVDQAARAECGSTLLFFAIVVTGAQQGHAVPVTVVAFIVKHVAEVGYVRSWRGAFAADGVAARPGWIWVTQSLSYAISNVDFLLVRVFCGVEAFSIYSLAFRVTSAPYAQLSAAIMRSSLLHLSTNSSPQRSYDRFMAPVFAIGGAAAVALVGLAWAAPVVLGDGWSPAVGVIIVLAIGLPWRMVMSIAGNLALHTGALRQLAWWEVLRLAGTAGALAAAASVGFGSFVAMVTVVMIVSSLAMHRVAGGATGVKPWRPLLPASLVGVGVAVLVSMSVTLG